MIFDDIHVPSIGPKLFFSSAIGAVILATGWLMFAGAGGFPGWAESFELRGDLVRRVAVLSALGVYFVRLLITQFVFLKRKMTWGETITISILMVAAVYAYAYIGGNNDDPLGWIGAGGMILYVFGSYLNTRSEQTRHVWKKIDTNQGRLYTEGLFRHSMHINYFGDMLLFMGLAMICGSISLTVIPLLMTVNFVFFIIPQLDRYLAEKYGDQFVEYAKRTRKLIPKIY